jgi:hypothetical protein
MLSRVIVLAVFILAVLLFKKYRNVKFEGFQSIGNDNNNGLVEVPDVKRPFVNFYDNTGNRLNIIGISKPFSGDEHLEEYKKYQNMGLIVIGVSSYLEFPNMISNPYENFVENYKKYRYKELCRAWLHGFRNPVNYFPIGTPHALISESDFMDCNVAKPDESVKKEYDFIYICLKQDEKSEKCDDWATYNKNWELAQKCLKVMCETHKLRGLLVGRRDCKLPGMCHELMDTTNMLEYSKMLDSYKSAKFLFVPNKADASPRVITEALLTDIPILVNENILGGWKYVNENTGVFFKDEHDISRAVESITRGIQDERYSPRRDYLSKYGVVNTGKRLKEFFYNNFGGEINVKRHQVDYVVIDNPKVNYRDCPLT